MSKFEQKVANLPTQEVLDELHKNIKTIPQSEVDTNNQGHADGMAQGMSDVWEVVRKLFAMKDNEFDDVFGNVYREDVFNYYTPQEALTKLKAYEEAQEIKVGDVVKVDEETAIVTRIGGYNGNDVALILYADGSTGECDTTEAKKTGKHMDIKSILESIGE